MDGIRETVGTRKEGGAGGLELGPEAGDWSLGVEEKVERSSCANWRYWFGGLLRGFFLMR